ncbi:MAG: hypothetical protein K2Y05_01845 [Hyphomicrobiaceae bacterium]|nr:hypothetical protein [Hyphomicrobiaceae bacterium]
MPVLPVPSMTFTAFALATSTLTAAAASGLPVPFQPSQPISFTAGATVVTGTFQPGDRMCRMALTSAEHGQLAPFDVKAGGKSRLAIAGQEIEVFCCPELRMVTLREVRRTAALMN